MESPHRKPANALPPGKKKLILGLIGATAVLVTGAGVYGMRHWDVVVIEDPGPDDNPAQRYREDVATRFQEVKNLIREGRWAEAKVRLLELQAIAPQMMELQDYLDRIEKEIPNQEHLIAAQVALMERKPGRAKEALDKISQDTQMFEQVSKLRRELHEAADSQTQIAKTLLDNGNPEGARQQTEDVLAAFPDHRDAKLLNEEATRLLRVRNREIDPTPWGRAVSLFVEGDMPQALKSAQQCSPSFTACKTGLPKMKEYSKLHGRLEDLDIKQLQKLLALDREITGEQGPSKMYRTASTRAANVFYKAASAARAAEQWVRAVESARRTLEVDPSHVGAQRILDELRTKAKELYLQAYALKDSHPDDAIPTFREVVAMTDPEDEVHLKAQSWLEKLSK